MVNVVSDNMSDETTIAVSLARLEGKIDVMGERLHNSNTQTETDRQNLTALTARVIALETVNASKKAVFDAAKLVWAIGGGAFAAVGALILRQLGV